MCGVGGACLGGRGLERRWSWGGAMIGTQTGLLHLHMICIQVSRSLLFLNSLLGIDLHAHLHTCFSFPAEQGLPPSPPAPAPQAPPPTAAPPTVSAAP